jgi:molecular chaperone HtpG
MSETASPATEQHDFGAEVGRLLDLVVHSLYSEREIFLRELVANAADATDRRRFLALSDSAAAPPEGAKVRIVPDKAAHTLTIEDDGVGMSHDEMVANLGTIARSGTRLFGQSLEGADPAQAPSLIGQFGVGFYAAFMVADEVRVTSRAIGADEAWTWSSEGRGNFTMTPAKRDSVGTTIVLHMKPDADEYLEPYRLETIVRKWADHITLPITVARDGQDEKANEGTALWRRPKAEVTEEQYEGFFRHLGHFIGKPWLTLHWRAEGTMEYAALLFIPDSKPFQPIEEQRTSKLRLHVKRMFITDEAELVPAWLRFVDGVVDTEDLPLNVSREMLQTTPVLARIRKAVTNRVIAELKSHAKSDTEGYTKFWENFGPILKEGVWEDFEHQKDVAPLLRFHSSTEEGWTSLDDYIGRIKPGQEAIYYLTGDNLTALRGSPQLEGFAARGIEVLLLTDPIDAFWPDRFNTYEQKPIRNVIGAVADLSALPITQDQPEAEAVGETEALTAAVKAALGGQVDAVRVTDRLVGSAVVLAPSEGAPDLQMQRLLRRAGRGGPIAAPVLELNPRHGLIRHLAAQVAAGAPIDEEAQTLFDLARVQDGDAPSDPAGFARRVAAFMQRGVAAS